ncbi:armadillo repeat-containing protein 1 [Aplysia californica]|uniref:Armadillo repeat-containing protein 1 n=1 Tax=Aplysia californica TaxID=6500 RepID=A0ABM0K382_APLCA|nr:armadillo repeat-containing protein 1 [Aplysia californica]
MVSTEAIAAMKVMAADSKKRAALVKDPTCVGGLVIVLSNPEPATVQASLETLNLLCECPEAPAILRKHMGMMDQLDALMSNSDSKNLVIKRLAETLYKRLCVPSETTQAPLRDSSNTSRRSTSSRNTSLSGPAKAKSIVLQLRGLHDKSDRDLCARLLLKVRGVISITFDLTRKRCILRTKLDVKPETLAASVARSMTMTALQVVKKENGDESYVNFNTCDPMAMAPPSQEKENADMPDYLSDDSDTTFVEEKAVKKPTKEDEKRAAGWFSVAANFLTNSFYW